MSKEFVLRNLITKLENKMYKSELRLTIKLAD